MEINAIKENGHIGVYDRSIKLGRNMFNGLPPTKPYTTYTRKRKLIRIVEKSIFDALA